MSQGKHLWDVLRDLLGFDAGGDGDGPNAGDGNGALRSKLSACNDELVGVARDVSELHGRAAQAQLRLTAILESALEEEQAGKHAEAARAREQIPALQSALDAAHASLKLAQARHGVLTTERNSLLLTLRRARAANRSEQADPRMPSTPSGEPPQKARAHPPDNDAANHEAMDLESDAAASQLTDLRSALTTFANTVHLASYAQRSIAQLDSLHSAGASCQAMLARKVNPGELTHQRYSRAAQQVAAAVRANLSDCTDVLRLLADLDPAAIARQIQLAEVDADAGVQALHDRVALRTAHAARLDSLLARNDEALTALLSTTAAVAQLPGLDEGERDDFDTLMADLEILTQRAQLFR